MDSPKIKVLEDIQRKISDKFYSIEYNNLTIDELFVKAYESIWMTIGDEIEKAKKEVEVGRKYEIFPKRCDSDCKDCTWRFGYDALCTKVIVFETRDDKIFFYDYNENAVKSLDTKNGKYYDSHSEEYIFLG